MQPWIKDKILDYLVGPVTRHTHLENPIEINGCFAMRKSAVTFVKLFKTWWSALDYINNLKLSEYTGQVSVSQIHHRGYRVKVVEFNGPRFITKKKILSECNTTTTCTILR